MTSNRKVRTLAMTTILVVLVAGAVYPYQRRQIIPNRDRMREILAKGDANRARWRESKNEAEKDAINEALRPIVLETRLGLQEVPTGRGDQVRFARAVLNSTGAKFDAVRFRTPDTGESFSLFYEIVVPGNVGSMNVREWGIVGVEGPSPVVDDWSRRDDFELPGVGFPEENVCITPYIRGEQLRPASEYILWFDLADDRPTPVYLKVKLTPAEPSPAPKSVPLSKARLAYTNAIKAANQKYDVEFKGHQKAYLAELDKVARSARSTDVAEADRVVAEIDEIARGEAAADGRRGFRVLGAKYGANDRWVDVADELRPMVRGNVLRFGLGADFKPKGGDPIPGTLKTLIIVYTLDGNTGVSITRENQRVELPPTLPSRDRIPPVGSAKP